MDGAGTRALGWHDCVLQPAATASPQFPWGWDHGKVKALQRRALACWREGADTLVGRHLACTDLPSERVTPMVGGGVCAQKQQQEGKD